MAGADKHFRPRASWLDRQKMVGLLFRGIRVEAALGQRVKNISRDVC